LLSYGLFKAKDKKLLDREDLALRLDTAEKINQEYVQPTGRVAYSLSDPRLG